MMHTGEQPVLVTGGAGFIGCNLADRLAANGQRVRIYDSLSRPGVEHNLSWLTERHGSLIEPVIADVRDAEQLALAARGVGAAFHFAAQVAVTTSMIDPRADLDTNILGTFNLLEAIRLNAGRVPVIFASTNKVYGDLASFGFALAEQGYVPEDDALAQYGVPETQPLDFHTPYGCSKGAADQYVIDYSRSFGLPTVVLRMSCVYGERQMGTEDQGWVAHFLLRALNSKTITLFGDGHQVRDILDVRDAVSAYMSAWRQADRLAGRTFNLGGGPGNAVSLRRLLDHVARIIGRSIDVDMADWRPGDQRWFVADTRAAERELGLSEKIDWRTGVERLAHSLADRWGTRVQAPTAVASAQ